ncbi:hypothetical protein V8G54_012878 [Vigna mungo]|uniref:Uncharacterized protein n=1 Tax=Vigna mungo TaxID=3915 RepID=A0AAQ3NUN2_VIGMU
MKKLTPMAATRILNTGRVGVTSNSFQTPCPCQVPELLGELEEEHPLSLFLMEAEAASCISASLNSASPLFSDVLIKTCFASSYLPFTTSQRGDSGIANTPSATAKAGKTATPSMILQFMSLGRLENT